MTFWHAFSPLIWLTFLGPMFAFVLARIMGGITWPRAMLWTIPCQIVVVLVYLQTHGTAIIIVYPGDPTPTGPDFLAANVGLTGLVTVFGLLVAAILTPVARWLTRR